MIYTTHDPPAECSDPVSSRGNKIFISAVVSSFVINDISSKFNNATFYLLVNLFL